MSASKILISSLCKVIIADLRYLSSCIYKLRARKEDGPWLGYDQRMWRDWNTKCIVLSLVVSILCLKLLDLDC